MRKTIEDLGILHIRVNYIFETRSVAERPYGSIIRLVFILAQIRTKLKTFQVNR